MNDINKTDRSIFYVEDIDLETVDNELSKYRQISFTKDNAHRSGYAIPAMWAHYAERDYGVCLVFDKTKLLSLLSSDMESSDIKYEDILTVLPF